MKRVIDGKVYDTKTAEAIHDWSNGYYQNDFNFCNETLYRTKKGAWFIYGEGGAMSGYARRCESNSFTGGDGLRVLTEAEALAWLEEHDADADVIQQHFPQLVEEA